MIYDIHIQVLLVIYGVIVCILITYHKIRKQKKRKTLLWRCLFALYMLLLLKVTAFPFTFEHHAWMNDTTYVAVQWKPLLSIISLAKHGNYIQIAGNIILLMPLPLMLQGIYEQTFSRIKCFLSICIASICIEVMQLGINYVTRIRNHVFDVDDIILNILGGVFFLILYKPFHFIADTIVSFASGDHTKTHHP